MELFYGSLPLRGSHLYSTVIFKLIDEYIFAGELMIKISGFLGLLLILVLPSVAQDYLDGGYVSSGDNGDMAQYFTDPIFRSPSGSYISPDPAVRGMQESLDRPAASIGSTVPRTPISKSSGKIAAKTSLTGVAGHWGLQLSDGRSVYLELYQSGARLFGRGSTIFGGSTQGAIASGSVSGNKMTVDLVPESGTELYSISLDISRLQLASKYTVYRYGAQPRYGTVLASRLP